MFHTMESEWPRRELFAHYMHNLRCTYSVTVPIDITRLRAALKANGLKAYPAQIYMMAAVVNRFREFRMGLDENGQPGYWQEMHPAYTIFQPDTNTFSSIWTPWQSDFATFYAACTADMARYAGRQQLHPQQAAPPNVFDISSVPWLDFTAFNLNVYAEGTHLPPIFTLGRYVEQGGKTLLPLAMQLHHAACDGYHAGQFVEALRAMAADCHSWL